MIDKKHFKTHIKNLRLKIDDFSNLIYTTFGMKNKNIFIHSNLTSPRLTSTTTNSNIIYPKISSNDSKINKITSNTEENFFQPNKLKNNIFPEFNHNILKDSNKILTSLQKTLSKIKDKNREERLNELFHKTFIISNKSNKKKFNKIVPKFIPKETKLLIQSNSRNKKIIILGKN